MKIEDKEKVLPLLSSLPIYFKNFEDALIYGQEVTLTLDEVQTVVRSNELSKLKDLKVDDNGEVLSVSIGRSKSMGNHIRNIFRSKSKSKSKVSKKSKFKCLTCQKIGLFKKDCSERGNKGDSVQIAIPSYEYIYECDNALVVTCLETKKI